MGKGGSVSRIRRIAMVGDSSVKSGDLEDWPSTEAAFSRVQRMQTKLHQWARQDRSCRFGDLFNLVYDPAFLTVAFERVARNDGAQTAGVDGATVSRIRRRIGVEGFLSRVGWEVKAREFEPLPARRAEIPKGTSGKLRKLGIPTVADRVVQAALKLVLEPIFEADFRPCSYGFRPRRRAQDAISEIHMFASRGYEWVAEADIRACFDNIDHAALMDRVRLRIKDRKVLALVKAFLKAGVMTADGEREETPAGTPQGGILSPLLANIALNVLDDHFTERWHRESGTSDRRRKRRKDGIGNLRICRYADDFVILADGSAEAAADSLAEAAALLEPLGLRLAPEKTGVAHIDEGFVFLGFWIQRRKQRGSGKRYVYTVPSQKAVQAIRARIKERTGKATQDMDFGDLLRWLGQTLRGWANYFRHAVAKTVFSAIDHYTWWRIVRWLRRKHAPLSWRQLRRRFCKPGTWQFATGDVEFRGAASVTVTRYRYRGARIPTPWEPRPQAVTA
jgi:RNA-directed DNA polymerase